MEKKEKTQKNKKSLLRRILKWTGITFLMLIIALILGLTISKPLELKIIETEINVELRKKQQEKLKLHLCIENTLTLTKKLTKNNLTKSAGIHTNKLA